MDDFHDGVNYTRTSCVIAVSKAKDMFEPFLHQVSSGPENDMPSNDVEPAGASAVVHHEHGTSRVTSACSLRDPCGKLLQFIYSMGNAEINC